MKEFELKDKVLQGIEIRAEQEKKKELKLISSQRKIRGLILWEYNEVTHILKRAQFKKQDVTITSLDPSAVHLMINNKVEINERCYYVQALNQKNAIKHLKNVGYSNFKV